MLYRIKKEGIYHGVLQAKDLFDAIRQLMYIHIFHYDDNELKQWGSAFYTGDGGCDIFPLWRIDKI